MPKKFVRDLLLIFLFVAWTVWSLNGIFKNYKTYSLISWVIVLAVVSIPYLLLYSRWKRKKKNEEKNYISPWDKPAQKKIASPKKQNPTIKEAFGNTQVTVSISNPLAHSLYKKYLEIQQDKNFIAIESKKFQRYFPEMVKREFEIFQDCVNLASNTKKFETLFHRATLGFQKIALLTEVQRMHPKQLPQIPNAMEFCNLIAEKIETRLQDSFDIQKVKAESLKTDKGKLNSWKKFLDEMLDIQMEHALDSLEFLNKVIEEVQNKIYGLESNPSIKHEIQTHPIENDKTNISTKTEFQFCDNHAGIESYIIINDFNEKEAMFFTALCDALEKINITSKSLIVDRLSTKCINVSSEWCYVGKIDLSKKGRGQTPGKIFMQIPNEKGNIKNFETFSIDECLRQIHTWVKWIQKCKIEREEYLK